MIHRTWTWAAAKDEDRIGKSSDRMEGRVWDTPRGRVGVTDAGSGMERK